MTKVKNNSSVYFETYQLYTQNSPEQTTNPIDQALLLR